VEDRNFQWSVAPELGVPADPLRCRLDFHHQAVVMTLFNPETVEKRVVSAIDVSHALASSLSFGSGLLPTDTLWWKNTRGGPIFAIYEKPRVRKLALQESATKQPRRFTIPLPGFIFLCSPGKPPWVFAVKDRPTKDTHVVYKAPLCNLHENGRSCPGSHKYPTRIADIVESFFTSFFTATADLHNRSIMFKSDVVHLWEFLDKKKTFPTGDMVRHGTVRDLMQYE